MTDGTTQSKSEETDCSAWVYFTALAISSPTDNTANCGGRRDSGIAIVSVTATSMIGASARRCLAGPENSAWWEHRWLAELLDIPLVTPADLRTESFDVIYRRTDEGRVRNENGELTWLAEALLEPVRDGRLGLVNSFGTGVGDDKLAHAYAEEMIRFYLGEEPLIRSVPTYDPGDDAVREEVLDRIDELVVKPRFGHGGRGVVVCAHASPEDRQSAAQMVRENPRSVVVQETITLSTHPTIVDGRLEPRHIDLRAFVYCGRGGERVLPGGLSRMALDEGALVVNSSQNGGAKDTWVLR